MKLVAKHTRKPRPLISPKHESALYQTIRDHFPPATTHFERVENQVSVGCPDVNVAHAGGEAWMELKVVKDGRIEVRHSQIVWFNRRCVYCKMNNVYVVARKNDDILMWRAREIYSHVQAVKKDLVKYRARVDKDSITFEPPLYPLYQFEISDENGWSNFRGLIKHGRFLGSGEEAA